MAPTPSKPTLTISTTTHLPGLGQPIIPGLGEPAVSRTAAWYERAYPHARPRPVVPFSDYMVPPETSNAAVSTSAGGPADATSAASASGPHSTSVESANPFPSANGPKVSARFQPALAAAAAPGTTSANRKDSAQETPSAQRQGGIKVLRAIISGGGSGSNALRSILSGWEDEERRAAPPEPFPAFDDGLACEMLWEDWLMGA